MPESRLGRAVATRLDEVVDESPEGGGRRTLVGAFALQKDDRAGWYGRIERQRGQMMMVVRDGIR